MSRTYRKPAYYVEQSDVSYANRELQWHRRRLSQVRPGGTGYLKRVKKDPEQYQRECDQAQAEFQLKVEQNGGSLYYMYTCPWLGTTRELTLRPRYVSRYQYVPDQPPSDQQVIDNAVAERRKMTRDGVYSETAQRSGFKRDATRVVRRANKKYCRDVVNDDNTWEDYPYPTRKLGKHMKWNWW